MKMDRATRSSWDRVKLCSEQYIPLSIPRSFSYDEYARIARGYIPRTMEDRWFIFLEGTTVFMHSSRMGTCIYYFELRALVTHVVMETVFANRDPRHYANTKADYDIEHVIFLIDWFLLGKEVPFPQIWSPE